MRQEWRRRASHIARHWLLVALWLGVLLLASWQEGAFQWRKHQLLHSTDATTRALGAHLIIGYSNPMQVRELVSKGLVGGIYIGTANMQGKTPDAIQEDMHDLSFAYGQQHGRELAALGVNVNFAPLADLSSPARR